MWMYIELIWLMCTKALGMDRWMSMYTSGTCRSPSTKTKIAFSYKRNVYYFLLSKYWLNLVRLCCFMVTVLTKEQISNWRICLTELQAFCFIKMFCFFLKFLGFSLSLLKHCKENLACFPPQEVFCILRKWSVCTKKYVQLSSISTSQTTLKIL